MDEKKPRKKSVSNTDNNKNKTFVKNTINLNPTIDDTIGEAKSDTVVFTWGRMNPPTIGHQKLVEKVVAVARQNNAMPHVYLSQSYDSKKNPLPYKTKIRLAKKAFGNIVTESRSKTLIQVMKELQEMGHTKAIMVVGSDRVGEFKKLLNTYNGKEFKFESISVVSAGERDPDAEGVSGMSASKMRALAAEGNVNEFKRGLPSRLQSSADKVMQNVRDGMQIAEELEAEGLLDEAVLTIAQRRKRAMAFRRAKARIKRGRMIAQRKFAPKEKLEKRARRAAIKLIRRRVAGKKGANYANLSSGEKMAVDRLVAKRQKAVGSIAKRLMPKVRKAERERLQAYHASQSPTKEQFEDVLNIIMEAYFKVDIEGLPKFFMDAASPGEVKVELRKLLKKPGEVVNDITRVQKADIIKAFRLQAAGKDVDGEKVGVEESLDDKFTNYLFEKMTVQDPDIKDREGTQPKRFHTGLTKSTKTKRDAQFKRQEKMADDDPNAYKPAPGDDTKTQTSKYTRKYHQMFGKEQNMKFDKRFRFNKKEAMTEEELFGHIDDMFNLFEMIEMEESSLEGLKKKSEKSGISYSILKKVYDRGLAAWKIGHRPGANQQQWAYARVNSFITKGKNTWGKADADLARQVRGEETELGEASELEETIRKEGNKWVIYSKDGSKKLGTYDSETAAKKRLGQIEFFKHRREETELGEARKKKDNWLIPFDIERSGRKYIAKSGNYMVHIVPSGRNDWQAVADWDPVIKGRPQNLKDAEKAAKYMLVKKIANKNWNGPVPSALGFNEEAELGEAKTHSWKSEGHYLPDGTEWTGDQHNYEGDVYTGKTHTPASQKLYHFKELPADVRKKITLDLDEVSQVDVAREKIKREKEADKRKHDRMMDRARSSDTQTVNRSPNTEEVVHDKCGTPECCGQCGTSDLNEAFVAAGFSDIMYANDFEEHKVHGGFALHPSVTEEGGAGDWGTKKLTKKYKKDTPGEIQEAIDFMEKHNIDFCENVYRPMSEKYFEFFREARRLYEQGEINVEGVNKQLLQTDLGEFAFYEDEEVPLDCPLVEEEELNKPKRGGAKKFYVYVRDPSTGNVKKVSFGQKGMSVHINDPAARKSFAARHQCDTRNDKTTASYWACRLPRYAKMLGMQVDNPGAWW